MIQRFKNKVKVLRADPHMQEVARGAVLAFLLKVIGAGLAFGFNIAVARLLGADGAGIYFLAMSIATIGSVVGRVGLDNAMLRFVAGYAANEQWGHVNRIYALGMRMSIAGSAAVSLLIFFCAPLVAAMMDKPTLEEPLRWISLSILPFALFNLHAESLKALKKIRNAMLVQGIGLPLLSLLLIFPLVAYAGVTGAVIAYAASSLLVMLLAIWFWFKAIPHQEPANEPSLFSELWASCKPLWMVSIMNRGLMPWAPILLLGFWVSSAEVGVFSAATRVAMLVSFLLVTVNNVVAPKFAELYAKGNMEALGSTARRTAALVSAGVFPIFLLLVIFSKQVMAVFGEAFVVGGSILAILLFGQFVNVLSGSVGYLLMMSGNEKYYRNVTIAFAVIQLVMIMLLTPFFGMHGAAVSVALSLAGVNIMSVVFVYRRLGIMTVPGLGRVV